MQPRSDTCTAAYVGAAPVTISRARAAYLLRAARSRSKARPPRRVSGWPRVAYWIEDARLVVMTRKASA